MKNLNTALILLMATTLLACGGSGGGNGGGNDGGNSGGINSNPDDGNTDDGNTNDGNTDDDDTDDNTPEPEAKSDLSKIKFTHKEISVPLPNGDPFPEAQITSISALDGSIKVVINANNQVKITKDNTIPASSYIMGVGDTEMLVPTGAISMILVDEDGNSHAVSGYLAADDYPELSHGMTFVTDPASQAALEAGWSGVEYGYLVSEDGYIQRPIYGYDGIITVSGDNWSAELGDVTLVGTVNGADVSGIANLDDMSGEFEGVDGQFRVDGFDPSEQSNVYYTTGAFVGDNGADGDAFAGGWFRNTLN